jgi:hypothetical protein
MGAGILQDLAWAIRPAWGSGVLALIGMVMAVVGLLIRPKPQYA